GGDRDRGPRRDNERGGFDRGGSRGGYQGRDDRGGYRGRDDRGGYQGRDDRDREPIKRLPIPDEVTGDEIDKEVRQELMSLPKTLAEDVARNLVMVARLIDEDPEQAYAFSRIALRLASRVAAVREAAGFAAYATQRYAEALAEFRASRRMTGSVELWPVMADCERGLGRPERAMAMAGESEVQKLDKAGQVEMRLVAAGARRDMGQIDAAIVTLQSPELASNAVHSWTPRLRYAYADALLEAGREDEAREWFGKALEADKDGSTDASDRLAELDGVEFVDALGEDAESDTNGEDDANGLSAEKAEKAEGDVQADSRHDADAHVDADSEADADSDSGRGGDADGPTKA
ncbi:Tetratricopeptide repeat-containing protein, partial [Streptomyces sp. PalvLS-984]